MYVDHEWHLQTIFIDGNINYVIIYQDYLLLYIEYIEWIYYYTCIYLKTWPPTGPNLLLNDSSAYETISSIINCKLVEVNQAYRTEMLLISFIFLWWQKVNPGIHFSSITIFHWGFSPLHNPQDPPYKWLKD